MGYKIIKGWSTDAPMDLPIPLGVGESVKPGNIFCLNNSGYAILGSYATNGSDATYLPFFCFDYDTVPLNVIGLTGNFMVEVDSDLYLPGNYTSNLGVTAKNGVFSIPEGSERIVGYVIRYSASSEKLIVTWKDN